MGSALSTSPAPHGMLRAPLPTPRRIATALTSAVLAVAVVAGPAVAAAPAAAGAPAKAGAAATGPAPMTSAQAVQLRSRVLTALKGSSARTVGVAIDVDGAGALVHSGSASALPPASTQKSYTGLSALLALGPSTRLRTSLLSASAPVKGTLSGPVYLVAGGDPYLTGTDLRRLARDVAASGVRKIPAGVRLDDSRYDSRRNAPGWAGSYVPGQSGPLSALAVDHNRWRSDRAFLADPALPAAVRLRDELRRAGVTVGSTVLRAPRPGKATVLAQHGSDPVSVLVRRTLKASDNFAAELLLKEVGRSAGGRGSSATGVAGVRRVLSPLGVPTGTAVDGSGLSRLDRQTPAGQVRLLQAARRTRVATEFRTALPRGCRDGTLSRRYCGTAASGQVWAKTGTLTGVRALSGYTTTASGRTVAFSFQLSGVSSPTAALAAIDRAVVVLATAKQ